MIEKLGMNVHRHNVNCDQWNCVMHSSLLKMQLQTNQHKHPLGARSSMATHQMHVSKEVLRPLCSVYKVLTVVIGLPS